MVESYLLGVETHTRDTDTRIRPILAVPQPGSDLPAHSAPFPPALIVTAGFDTLLDEGISFAVALAKQDPEFNEEGEKKNSKVTSITYGQSGHGFLPSLCENREAFWQMAIILRLALKLDPPPMPK